MSIWLQIANAERILIHRQNLIHTCNFSVLITKRLRQMISIEGLKKERILASLAGTLHVSLLLGCWMSNKISDLRINKESVPVLHKPPLPVVSIPDPPSYLIKNTTIEPLRGPFSCQLLYFSPTATKYTALQPWIQL